MFWLFAPGHVFEFFLRSGLFGGSFFFGLLRRRFALKNKAQVVTWHTPHCTFWSGSIFFVLSPLRLCYRSLWPCVLFFFCVLSGRLPGPRAFFVFFGFFRIVTLGGLLERSSLTPA